MAQLKWDGDELFLGKTKMAEVRQRGEKPALHEYVLGPEDKVSPPYERKEDARSDCMHAVMRLLKSAGVS